MAGTMKNERNAIRHFSPAWYASVMGTGGLVNALYMVGNQAPALRALASALFWLNLALFVVFLVPWTLRWLLHFDRLREDLRNPIMSNFFVTMPVGAIVLGAGFFGAGSAYFAPDFVAVLDLVVWSVSVILILAFGVSVLYSLFQKEALQPEQVNFSWFITPVASIVVPLLGNPLAKAWLAIDPATANFINLVDASFFGIGFFLFILIGAVVFNSLLHHKVPHAAMAPTFWIILGPIGVGTLSLLGLADASKALGLLVDPSPLLLLSVIIWGFGLWGFILTLAMTIKYLRSGGIPFTLSWWAFIFPLAAYTLSTFAVANLTKVAALRWYGIVLLVLLVALWLLTFLRSLMGALSGKLFMPPQAPQGKPAPAAKS